MNNSEKESQNQDQEKNQGKPWWESERWVNCCQGIGNVDSNCCSDTEMQQAMGNCFSCCRYLLLFPVILGIIFLLLGYYLNSEIIRVLWMISAGVVAGMGLFGALAMRRFAAGNSFSGCCGAWPRRKN
ncbi:hypothetical protein ACFL6U_27595 [Planctomycetota bacterium]